MLYQTTSSDVVLESFKIRKKHINKLKELAMEGPATASFHCSTVVVAYAYARVCHIKTRWPKNNDKNKHAFLVGDQQPHRQSGDDHEGNRDAIMAFKEGPFKALTEELPKRYKALLVEPLLSVVEPFIGLLKFKVYDMNFRWERLSKVEITPIDKTGAMAVAESKEEEGSIEMGLMKPHTEMETFSPLNYIILLK
ncbi:hypothetical protein ZIOFF_018483 [Zingiber officinale]|uniref:Uncharacterized protein n=1 Tax=Zingiber officinale TaxID=94328 RepID=A0A8J5LAZ0_ZINOF|nr:hypothetical protein ZIOFF_018483 [Zingiber officinale]